MRKIIASAFVSLDGVMQAPGGPGEDSTGGFKFGGWIVPYQDDATGAAMRDTFSRPFDLLLGRKTYDIFAAYWPHIENHPIADLFNRVTKYVATSTPETLAWGKSEWLGKDPVAALRAIRAQDGPDLLTQGSSVLLQTLLAHDLIDELRLLIFPLTLGSGKRLFSDGVMPGALKLLGASASTTGVIICQYARGGEITTGSFQIKPAANLE